MRHVPTVGDAPRSMLKSWSGISCVCGGIQAFSRSTAASIVSGAAAVPVGSVLVVSCPMPRAFFSKRRTIGKC